MFLIFIMHLCCEAISFLSFETIRLKRCHLQVTQILNKINATTKKQTCQHLRISKKRKPALTTNTGTQQQQQQQQQQQGQQRINNYDDNRKAATSTQSTTATTRTTIILSHIALKSTCELQLQDFLR